MSRCCYLLHFSKPYKHAKHYLGSADDLFARLQQHNAGQGARLTQVVREAGIDLILARTWNGDRSFERRLKRQHNSPRLCPICNPPHEPEPDAIPF
jgi:predicted GIY-YIG superfamily endonuclease